MALVWVEEGGCRCFFLVVLGVFMCIFRAFEFCFSRDIVEGCYILNVYLCLEREREVDTGKDEMRQDEIDSTMV